MSFLPPKRRCSKTPFTIVLDMDETLLSSIILDESNETPLEKVEKYYSDDSLYHIRVRSFRVPFYDPVELKGTGAKYDCWGMMRPHLEEFLTFAFEYFKNVVVWSAGRFSYVRRLTKEISKDTDSFDLVWTYDNCTDEGMGKPLKKLLKEHPHLGDLSKVFIVDDKPSSIEDNIANGIVIPVYSPELNIDSLGRDDDALLRLKAWFLLPEVMNATDIRTLNKKNIFKH